MKAIRVLMLGMPTMLRQILRSIVAEAPGVVAVTELPHHNLRSPEVLESRPDLVIVAAEEAAEKDVTALLERCRPLRVLAVLSDGTSGFLYEMTPHRTRIEGLSRDAVAKAILKIVSDAQIPSSANGD